MHLIRHVLPALFGPYSYRFKDIKIILFVNICSKFFISHICFHRKCNVILKCITVFCSYLYNHGSFLQVTFPIYLSLLYHLIFFMQLFFIKNIRFFKFTNISYSKKAAFQLPQITHTPTPSPQSPPHKQ